MPAMADRIREDTKEEERKKYISNINKQSIILAEIINDLLDVSRIESEKGFTPDKVPSDMSHIIREVTSSFQFQTDKHTFDIILPEEPVVLMVDRKKMEQVRGNILSNAVKYSPEGGLIQVRGEIKEDNYHVSIKDEGIGMTPDQAESGKEATTVAKTEKPDLIIMDVMMPGEIDGLEATRILKNDPETRGCTIIMLTAKGMADDRKIGFAAGADDYFVKPFSPLKLINKVEGVLG